MKTSNQSRADKSMKPSVADQKLLRFLSDGLLPNLNTSRKMVFLAGAQSTDSNNFRAHIRKAIETPASSREHSVLYPEDLFDDLLEGKFGARDDLLSLEKMLAQSVHGIVIVLESAGAIAELGAFCALKSLRKKTIVLVDRRHRKDRSFIMLGPIRQLKKENPEAIFFVDFSEPVPEDLGKGLLRALRNLPVPRKPPAEPTDPITATYFLLGAVYVRDSLTWHEAEWFVKAAAHGKVIRARPIARTALSVLERERFVRKKEYTFEITPEGCEELLFRVSLSARGRTLHDGLDTHRANHMNWKLRGRDSKMGEANT